MIVIITMNSNKIIINTQDHFKKYVEKINKLPFEKQLDYVHNKLDSLNNVDVKFEGFF